MYLSALDSDTCDSSHSQKSGHRSRIHTPLSIKRTPDLHILPSPLPTLYSKTSEKKEREMESQYKDSSNGGIENGVKEVVMANERKSRGCDIVLRILALALSLAAAVVLGVNKETTTVAITLVPTLPPVNIPVTAKSQYLSAFVFFVVANAIACGYAAISLLLPLANGQGKKTISIVIILFDLVMVALLFSGIGAAMAIGIMGYEGNSHVQWKKVCNVFDKFCDQAAVAMGLSGVAAVAFFLLVAIAALNLHKKH